MSLNMGLVWSGVAPINRTTAATNSALVIGRFGIKLPSGRPVSTPAFVMVDTALLNQLFIPTSENGFSWLHSLARSSSEVRRNKIVAAWALVVEACGRTVPSVKPIMKASWRTGPWVGLGTSATIGVGVGATVGLGVDGSTGQKKGDWVSSGVGVGWAAGAGAGVGVGVIVGVGVGGAVGVGVGV